MAIERGEAFVLRVHNYAESDQIVTLFTERWGKRAAIAKGARRFNSRLGGTFDLLNRVEVVFYAKPRLDLVSQASLVESYDGLKGDYAVVEAILAVGKLLDRLLPLHQAESPAYDIFTRLLLLVENDRSGCSVTVLAAMLKLLSVLGHRPRLASCVRCGGDRGPLMFSPTRGGIVCANCGDDGIELTRGLSLSLDALVERPLSRAGIVRISQQDVQRAREILDVYVRALATSP